MQLKNSDILGIMLDVPHSFSVNGKHYFVYPPSLAMIQLNAELMQKLEINEKVIVKHSVLECMRIAKTKREECCRMIAYNTFNKKEDILDAVKIEERTRLFCKKLDEDDIVNLLITCLSVPNIKELISFLKIDEKNEIKERVLRVKQNNNTYEFGGKSLYGSIIGSACEKFGWSYDYVLWEISYANLQLLLSDAVTSVYLTDDEIKNNCLPRPNSKKVKVTADNLEEIKKRFS